MDQGAKTVTCCCLLLLIGEGICSVAFNSVLIQEWNSWKVLHKKAYTSVDEEWEKSLVWLSNKKFIDSHNSKADQHGYTLAMNEQGDLTNVEWREMYLGYISSSPHNKTMKMFVPPPDNYPEEMDWRVNDAVAPVKNQGQCNASYAFSAMGALEGAMALACGKLLPLSEQNIIDCSIPYGNHGCHGGNVYMTYQYVIDVEGVDLFNMYPYKAVQSQCQFMPDVSGAHMSGVLNIKSGSEHDLLAAVATLGPVAAAADASSNAFRFYDSGVFDSIHCSSTNLNHAMVITGYGIETTGKKFWLVKNSWGRMWGENGYIKMVRDQFNQCGIATDALYPTL